MFNGTPETIELCERMAKVCRGTVIFGFSNGKDSLAAWLFLRNFFNRIIPFYGAVIPGLEFVERSLKYYETVFGTTIERCLATECMGLLLARYMFQLPGDEAEIDALDLWEYSEHSIGHLIARKHGVPYAWNALGFSIYDSLDRIGWVKKCQGKHQKHYTFYPCWNWKQSEVLEYIQQHGISLSEDYLVGSRSFRDIYDTGCLENIRDRYPEDWRKIKAWFPLIEARIARNEFRKAKLGVK